MTCEFAKSDMTPCVQRDGAICYAQDSRRKWICVGCERTPAETGVKTPCVRRDGPICYVWGSGGNWICVGCDRGPAKTGVKLSDAKPGRKRR